MRPLSQASIITFFIVFCHLASFQIIHIGCETESESQTKLDSGIIGRIDPDQVEPQWSDTITPSLKSFGAQTKTPTIPMHDGHKSSIMNEEEVHQPPLKENDYTPEKQNVSNLSEDDKSDRNDTWTNVKINQPDQENLNFASSKPEISWMQGEVKESPVYHPIYNPSPSMSYEEDELDSDDDNLMESDVEAEKAHVLRDHNRVSEHHSQIDQERAKKDHSDIAYEPTENSQIYNEHSHDHMDSTQSTTVESQILSYGYLKSILVALVTLSVVESIRIHVNKKKRASRSEIDFATATKKLDDLRNVIEEHNQSYSQVLCLTNKLKQDIQHKEDSITYLSNRIDSLGDLESRNDFLTIRKSELVLEKENLESRKKILSKNLKDLEKNFSVKENQTSHIQSKLDDLDNIDESEVHTLSYQIDDLVKEKISLSQHISEKDNELEDIKSVTYELDRTNLTLKKDLEGVEDLDLNIRTLKVMSETLPDILKDCPTTAEGVENLCNNYKPKIESLQASIEQMMSKQLECDKKIDASMCILRQLKQFKDDQDDKHDKLNEDIVKYSQMLEEEKEELSDKERTKTERLNSLKIDYETFNQNSVRLEEHLKQVEEIYFKLTSDQDYLNSELVNGDWSERIRLCHFQTNGNIHHAKNIKKKEEHVRKEISALKKRLGFLDDAMFMESGNGSIGGDNGALLDDVMSNSSANFSDVPPPLPMNVPPPPPIPEILPYQQADYREQQINYQQDNLYYDQNYIHNNTV